MSADPRWIRRLDAWYGVALRLYPRRFRVQWEQPMRQAFRDRCREIARGQRRPAALLTELLPDLAFGLGRERMHDLGEDAMSRHNVLLALLVLLAGTIAMHDRIGTAGTAAIDWWKDHRAQANAQAERRYWSELAQAIEPAGTPRAHTVAAIAWQAAAFDSSGVPVDREATTHAQQAFDAAIDGQDPAALWLAAIDCPVRRCDAQAAIATLQRLDPDNAAVALLAFDQAAAAGDAERQALALGRLAASPRYHGYEADLMKSLLEVDARASAPRHASADELVAGVAMAWAIPAVDPLLDACRPGSGDAALCRAAGAALSAGNAIVARATGARILYRYAAPGVEREAAAAGIRNIHWLLRNLDFGMDDADMARWREAWLAGDGEFAVFESNLAARGIPLQAPATFDIDPKYLDPAR